MTGKWCRNMTLSLHGVQYLILHVFSEKRYMHKVTLLNVRVDTGYMTLDTSIAITLV